MDLENTDRLSDRSQKRRETIRGDASTRRLDVMSAREQEIVDAVISGAR